MLKYYFLGLECHFLDWPLTLKHTCLLVEKSIDLHMQTQQVIKLRYYHPGLKVAFENWKEIYLVGEGQ